MSGEQSTLNRSTVAGGVLGTARAAAHYWVLAISLLLTVFSAVALDRAIYDRDWLRFRNLVQSTQDSIQDRLDTYIALLLATRGFVAAKPDLDEEDFHRYVEHLELERRYPGIQGIGFSARVVADDLPEFERKARGARPEFGVWPRDPRPEYHVIRLIEPMNRRNLAALGFDGFSEPTRRAAMQRAWDSGAPSASRKVMLVQEIDPAKQAGFLIYVPLYDDVQPGGTLDRRKALRGFVYGAFRSGDLLSGLLSNEREPRVTFEVYDGLELRADALMYRAVFATPGGRDWGRFHTTSHVVEAGEAWTLVFNSTPWFERQSNRHLVPALAGVGLLTSWILFFVTRSQVRARAQSVLSEAAVEAERNNLRTLTADLQRAVRVRDDFLSIAGHELKTPLAALSLQVQGLERQAEKGAFGEAGRLLERLQKATRHVGRLESLVGELLDVSRIAAGRLTLQLEELDLGALAGEIVERFAEQAARSGSVLSLHVVAPVIGVWDRVRLDQVITNLVGNAIKYGAGGPVELVVGPEADRAKLAVRDQGIGIASEDRERIFGRFERAASERHYGGLGLGLWISRQIVEALGGRIGFVSELGKGSVFTVELPFEAPAPSRQ